MSIQEELVMGAHLGNNILNEIVKENGGSQYDNVSMGSIGSFENQKQKQIENIKEPLKESLIGMQKGVHHPQRSYLLQTSVKPNKNQTGSFMH